MTKLLQTILNRPITILMFYIGIILLGIISFSELAIDLFPPIEFPQITIRTVYPKAMPEEVEYNLTRPLEESIASIDNVKEIYSRSLENESIIKVTFYWGTNMKYASLSVRERIDKISEWLPMAVKRSIINQRNPQNSPIMLLTLSGDNLYEQKNFAEYIVKRRLEQIKGVASVELQGAPEREIQILFNPDKLAVLNISTDEISRSLRNNNILISGGSIKQGYFRKSLRIEGEFRSAEEIANTFIAIKDNRLIKLRQIADVKDTFKERESLARINGKECIGLAVIKESGSNTINISAKIEQTIDQLTTQYSDIEITRVYTNAKFIERSVYSVINAIIFGGILAFISLFIFLNDKRSPFILLFSIPLSLIITLIVMYMRDISLNIISLAGLALGTGMLVDNSIVILENIHRLKEKGLSLYEAAWRGVKEVVMPITASTLTTIAVFLPIIFLKDISSFIFRQQAETAAYALLASLFVGITVIPILYYKFTKEGSDTPKPVSTLWYKKIEDIYHQLLQKALRYSGRVISFVIFLLLFSFILFAYLDRRLLPDVEQNAVEVNINFLPGSTIEFIENKALNLEKILSGGVIYSQLGKREGSYVNINETKINRTYVYRKDKEPYQDSDLLIEKFKSGLSSNENIEYSFRKVQTALSQLFDQQGGVITVDIQGTNLTILDTISLGLISSINRELPGRITGSNFFEKHPSIRVVLNRDKIVRYGLTEQQFVNHLKYILKGEVATEYRHFDHKYDVLLRGEDEYREDLDKLLNTTILGYPVKKFVSIHPAQYLSSIERLNQARIFQIRLQSKQESYVELHDKLKVIIDKHNLPRGYTADIGGDWKETQNSLNNLSLAFLLSIMLVYLILSAQFESLKLPFIILFTIPLSLIGIIPLLYVTNMTLNIISGIGFVVIAGIVVNDGIIKIEFINRTHRSGKSIEESILIAGKMRLRPILITTITTVFGLMPLALGLGKGAEFQQPMAIAIVGGISVSTVLTLFVLPILYKWMMSKDVSL